MSSWAESVAVENVVDNTKDERRKKIRVPTYFTEHLFGRHPYTEITWTTRDAVIMGKDGPVFEQKGVEAPEFWSDQAVNIVAQKYFAGKLDTPQRETSVKQLIDRVVDRITQWVSNAKYFETQEDVEVFSHELTYLLIHQMASFNSPVWFNLGVDGVKEQCSACFILNVEDSMESILDWYKEEGLIFKSGSGAGTNLSKLRSSKERLGGGGHASGPVSFMRGADASAGTIKSGGRTRRAAKMVRLDVDHPDILEFIDCKAREEEKALVLQQAGFDVKMNGRDEYTIQYQNANNSVGVSDAFMEAATSGDKWQLKPRVEDTHYEGEVVDAEDILDRISKAAHRSGCPGLHFDTTINDWHTCLDTDRIYSSNPCSEYVFLDNTACNLASLNLVKFLHSTGFDSEAFDAAVKIMIVAMESLVSNADYPTPKMAQMSHDYRTLGLGYTNLGAYLMRKGIAYDSDKARTEAALITCLMQGSAYEASTLLARAVGPFPKYYDNIRSTEDVVNKHVAHVAKLHNEVTNGYVPTQMVLAQKIWSRVSKNVKEYGVRNAQLSVLAPTGTISFMMDCDTTGIEPELAHVKYKVLAGGGTLKILNKSVKPALERLGYTIDQIERLCNHMSEYGTLENSEIHDQDLPVFDTSFPQKEGGRAIHYMAHIKMMAAVQPFISGAISKTVNMPADATVEDVKQAYIEAWKSGLKAIAIYRDGCKNAQPLSTKAEKTTDTATKVDLNAPPATVRHPLPDDRMAMTHRFSISGHHGYLTVGLYENGQPGELFIKMAKEGSTISGLLDSFACSISIGLQHGVPLQTLVNKFAHTRFEPSGFTRNKDVKYAKSIMDYIFRWLEAKFLKAHTTLMILEDSKENVELAKVEDAQEKPTDAPLCHDCGSLMVRRGSCHSCDNCGSSSGCS